jgi:hypothetical protein
MLIVVVLSQNAHIQLVPNLIRGRYFTSAYYVMVLALCLMAATSAVDMFGANQEWRQTRFAILTSAIIAIAGSFLAHSFNPGPPPHIATHQRVINVVAEQISAAKFR